MKHATTFGATQVSYSRSKLLEKKIQKLLSLRVDNLNKKKTFR